MSTVKDLSKLKFIERATDQCKRFAKVLQPYHVDEVTGLHYPDLFKCSNCGCYPERCVCEKNVECFKEKKSPAASVQLVERHSAYGKMPCPSCDGCGGYGYFSDGDDEGFYDCIRCGGEGYVEKASNVGMPTQLSIDFESNPSQLNLFDHAND